jgi:hypothetical protein
MKIGGISADPPAAISLGTERPSHAAMLISRRHVTRILDLVGREMASLASDAVIFTSNRVAYSDETDSLSHRSIAIPSRVAL